MRRLKSTIAAVSVSALAIAGVPMTIAATTASWPDSEWVHGSVGTSSYRCGTDTGYAGTSYGRFLAGEILGQDLDPIVELSGVTLDQDAAGTTTVDPATSTAQPATPPNAVYTNPLNVSALSLVDIDLTGLTTNLNLGEAGAVNQYAQVSGYGNASGASGLVSNSGAVGITPTTPDADLPEPATIGLSTFLPAVAGIADANLEVGAVAASSQLDWCAALRSALWGDGSVSGVTRDYGIAGLGLAVDSPLLGGLVTEVTDTLPDIQAAIDSLLGTNGLISNTIAAQVALALAPGQNIASVSGTVSLSGLDLAGSVATLLSTPLGDGVVSIDLVNGTIDVDLDALLGYDSTSINNLAPNTELVINDAVINDLVLRVGNLLDDWTDDIVNALTQEIYDAQLTVDLDVALTLTTPAIPPLVPEITVPLLTLGVDLVAPVGSIMPVVPGFPPYPPVTFGITITAAGVPIPPILTTALNALSTGLITPIASLITTTVISVVTNLGATLATLTAPIVTAVATLLAPLDEVLSIMANVQPDQPGAPDPGAYIPYDPATPETSAQYVVSALRIGLLGVVPGDVANLSFGTASAGPITAP